MTSFNPLVSIIIPVYNGSNFMREAINSALDQTYNNIEVIVVNDGSNDGGLTESIAKSYGHKIKYFTKINGGVASALNLGIKNMHGEYFSWLSHDDVYFPAKIEHQVRLLTELSNKNVILYGGYELINSNSKVIGVVKPHIEYPQDKLNISLFPLMRGLIHGCSMLIPIRYFREIGTFDESLLSTQDYALWFKFFRVAQLYYDPHILIRSRIHPDQGTYKINTYLQECNHLWCGFIKNLTELEMIAMEGTVARFFIQTAIFLSNTPFDDAKKLCEKMAEDELNHTLVSVIIPFRNRIDVTIEAVRSVLYNTHQSIEIICVDDGSTDCLKDFEVLLKSDPRIIYIRLNGCGPSKARNAGLFKASGKYVAFLDSDDLFIPEKIQVQLRKMEEYGWSISHTSYERIDWKKNSIDYKHSGLFSGDLFPKIITNCPIATPTVMGTLDLFKKYFFPENLQIGEDVCLWIKISQNYKFGGIDQPLTRIRVGPETAATNINKQIIGRLNIAAYLAQDPSILQYGRYLKLFLKDTVSLIPATNGFSRRSELQIKMIKKLFKFIAIKLVNLFNRDIPK